MVDTHSPGLPPGVPAAASGPLPPAATESEARLADRRRGGGFNNIWTAIKGNRKATVGAVLLAIFTVLALVPGLIAPYDPEAEIFPPSEGPSAAHWLGTTHYGQDILSQVVWGARPSMVIAFGVGLFATLISIVAGVTAAYIGGLTDSTISLVTDVFLVIPTFPLIIVIASYAKSSSDLVLIFVLVITGWSYGARQLRVQALSLRRRDFLESARVRGERRSYIIAVEILPTMTSLLVANFLGAALYAVLTAAGLQFIGLGDPAADSWGTMLYWAKASAALQTEQYLWAIVPGVCIATLGAAFALLNFAFDEISNPALRPVRRPRVKRTHP
jgi:peptide/nickel transport system permease protein